MNIQELERHVRTGLPLSKPSERVSGMIDERLASTRRRRTIRHRFTVALTATACLTAGLLMMPIVKAYAELQRLAGALDNVHSVVMTGMLVGSDGSRQVCAREFYLDGKWKIEEPNGTLSYFANGTRYRLDKAIGRFVVETGLKGPFANNDSRFSLSSLVGDFEHWQPRIHVTIDQTLYHGQSVTRAIAEDPNDPSRVVIYAATDTDLPLEVDNETKQNGSWVLTGLDVCDYQTKQTLANFVPDLHTYPPISQDEYDSDRVKQLITGDLGSVPLGKGRLIVRAMDVASDGTVFVVCQSGEKVPMWNRGYPIDISDDLGTRYSLLYVESRIDPEVIARSADGKAELCVFIPTEPIRSWVPRKISVTASLHSDKQVERYEWGMWANRAGQVTSMMWYYDKSKKVQVVDVAGRTFDKPTVTAFPSYAAVVDPSMFDDPSHFDQEKAKSRADFYRGLDDSDREVRWLDEVMRIPKNSGEQAMAGKRLAEIGERSKAR